MTSPSTTPLADANQRAVTVLRDALTVPVHPAPVPTQPPAGPCVVLDVPELLTHTPTAAGCGVLLDLATTVTVLAGDTLGTGLLDLADQVLVALADAGYTLTVARPFAYEQGDTPAPTPSLTIIAE